MKKTIISMTMALACTGATLFAQNGSELKFEVTPYLWLAGIEGDVTIQGQKTDFDKDFSDLVDAVDIAGSLLTIVQYDRFLFWGQVDYFSTDTDELDLQDRPQGGRLETDMTLLELAVGYQVDGWAEGQTFDILLGVRYMDIENTLTLKSDGSVREHSRDLTDPILVIRPSMPILPSKINGLRFNPTLAIGGGGDSDLVYELFPQIQYEVTENAAIRVGYRTVGYHFEGDNNDDELNISLSGLILGFGMKF